MESLKDKVVIVTGASSGIGKACAEAFAQQGCKVMLAARDETKLNEATQHIRNSGGTASSCQTDVSKEEDCRKLIDTTIREFGTIHILINNAGISMRALFNDAGLDVIRRLMEINFWGTVQCTKFALPEILKNKGSVVGVSSIAGYAGLPGRTGYSASKFAMQGFVESLRVENLKTGMHVLIACPGYTESNIRNTALNKDGMPQGQSPLDEKNLMPAPKVAAAIVEGVRKRKRTIILTSQGKLTVLFRKFFPAMIDRMAYKMIAGEKDSPVK